MKLINLFTIWYLAISAVVLLIGGILIYKKLESEIDFEVGRELERQLDVYAGRIENGIPPEKLQYDRLEIKELAWETPIQDLTIRDTVAWHEPLERMERQLKVGRSYKLNGGHFYLSTYNVVVETNDITETVVLTMVSVFLLQLLFIAFFARGISKRILEPFYRSLEKMRLFSFQQNLPMQFPPSKIKEFNMLNEFLTNMSLKLLSDYQVAKEYSENISHEIQTPLSVIRGKLELLMNSQINDQQAGLIDSAFQSTEKMTRIVNSLTILAKLQNKEFDLHSKIDFSKKIIASIEDYSDLISLKNIRLEIKTEDAVQIVIDPVLGDVLLSNLISNAIKHNFPNGSIRILLNSQKLEVINNGAKPDKNVNRYFDRFQKGNSRSDSIGLGLSIVKQICMLYGFSISYNFDAGFHFVKISFEPS